MRWLLDFFRPPPEFRESKRQRHADALEKRAVLNDLERLQQRLRFISDRAAILSRREI